MATSKDTVAAALDALAPLDVRSRAMFGEYVVYCDDKVVLLICDDRVHIKPTAAVEAYAARFESEPPFPGARNHPILDDGFMADASAFRALVQETANLLPKPRPKSKKKKK